MKKGKAKPKPKKCWLCGRTDCAIGRKLNRKIPDEEDDGIPGEVPKGRPPCFSCCAENPEWLLKKFGVKEGDCDKCKHYKACFKAF